MVYLFSDRVFTNISIFPLSEELSRRFSCAIALSWPLFNTSPIGILNICVYFQYPNIHYIQNSNQIEFSIIVIDRKHY